MAKTDAIIRIINLLHHRRSVSLGEIVRECRISVRTAYRYLNSISEAHVPVYFSKQHRGYTLSNRWKLALDNLRFDEVILLGLALKTLATRVNPAYRELLNDLLRKVFARQYLSLMDLWEVDGSAGRRRPRTDLSELLVLFTVQMAARCDRDIELRLRSGRRGARRLVVAKPVLRFRRGWQVASQQGASDEGIPVAEIAAVLTR